MGVTNFSKGLVDQVLNDNKLESVMELGAQNLYLGGPDAQGKYPYANGIYENRGLSYACIDLSGENGAQAIDLSQHCAVVKQYDMVTDFGTSEHVLGIYECWKTKHKLTKRFMINENPKVGNWPDHGYWYYTQEFYQRLAEVSGYKIVKIGEHPAMGNENDGWNIYCILEKIEEKDLIGEEEFMTLISKGGKEIPGEAPVTRVIKSSPKSTPAIKAKAKKAVKKTKAKKK